MTALFANAVVLRGFLAKDAEAPSSDHIQNDSFAVLLMATVSGVWNLGANEWIPRTDWHRIICPGPFFCGFTRGMRRGDYIEVTGELHRSDSTRTITIACERFPVTQSTYDVHALQVRRLEIPSIGVDESEDG